MFSATISNVSATNLQKKHRISSFLSKNALINERYRFIASINISSRTKKETEKYHAEKSTEARRKLK